MITAPQRTSYLGSHTWSIKKTPRISLPLFILLAALLHVSTIFLFNIVYQAPLVHEPITAQVLFLLPGSQPSLQIAAWVQAHNPSIFSPIKTVNSVRQERY